MLIWHQSAAAGRPSLNCALDPMKLPAIFLFTLMVVGCATTSDSALPSEIELAASLSFVAGDTPLDRGAGIQSVGDHFVLTTQIQIAPGMRKIGYNCPGFIFVDGAPTVWHRFKGGVAYEMYCVKGEPVFRARAP